VAAAPLFNVFEMALIAFFGLLIVSRFPALA
jgi:hypothetical protein